MDVEGSSVLSGYEVEAQQHVPDRQFIAKIEMAMGCRDVGGKEAEVKCGGMQRCCEGERPGVRSRRSMEHVLFSTKTSRVGAAAYQS